MGIFAVLGHETITASEVKDDNEEFRRLASSRFCDLPTIMLTLISFVNADSIASIYEPLILADWTLTFYFVPFICVVTIALMNVVTATIVEEAIEQSKVNDEFQNWWRE